MRDDIYRPSVINPAEYDFVGLNYIGNDDLENIMVSDEREFIRNHMQRTGGHYSTHEHGGNCHICGANCMYLAVFYHPITNTYIITGMDCASKMDMGDTNRFRAFRKAVHDARENLAGKNKAKVLLEDKGMSRVWEIYNLEDDPTDEPYRAKGLDNFGFPIMMNSFTTLLDIVSRLIKYGSLSDKQFDFVNKLAEKIDNWDKIKAERIERKRIEDANSLDCPIGRVEIVGTVISTKWVATDFGNTEKMLVKDDRGFRVWGTVPTGLNFIDVRDDEGHLMGQRGISKDDRVKFSAKVTPKTDDPKFGFYSRPTKAELMI